MSVRNISVLTSKRLCINVFFGLALLLLVEGCTSPEMKGTPFYSGEYGTRKGSADQRVNGWPIVYYRDPALSVLWPVFESTEDHFAVRPVFSVYGLEEEKREYNVIWPLAQFDQRSGDCHVFPVSWGKEHAAVFPVYSHYGEPWGEKGGSDSVFPLYWYSSSRGDSTFISLPWMQQKETNGDYWHTIPLLYYQSSKDEERTFLTPLWMQEHKKNGDNWHAIPPVYYRSSNQTEHTLLTPLWAQGQSEGSDWRAVIPLCYWDRSRHKLLSPLWVHWEDSLSEGNFAPWALSWHTHDPKRDDLWFVLGTAHASWGPQGGSHHVFPLYYRNEREKTFLSPICGWDRKGHGFFYPFTPLAGIHTGKDSGSWVFPIYKHSREKSSGCVKDRFLLLSGYEKYEKHESTGVSRKHWLFPLYKFSEDEVKPGKNDGSVAKDFWCLPFCWRETKCTVHSDKTESNTNKVTSAGARNSEHLPESFSKNGAFPFWSYKTETFHNGKARSKFSLGILLYDYKQESGMADDGDYTRARVLWRLWHYEKVHGHVSVDVFPAFTYDRKTDGFKKASFFWRLFRYEQAPNGNSKLDVLFMPVKR